MDGDRAFFSQIQNLAFWRRLAPWLHIDEIAAGHPAGFSSTRRSRSRPGIFSPAGYAVAAPLLDQATAATLARAVGRLRAHAIHPTFVYVYDETWGILDALRPHLASLLGDDYEVLADAWAFYVDPRTDRGGWPIHRGCYEDVRDTSGRPSLVNIWIALTNASLRNACMHLVPLPDDPHYPADLENHDGLEPLGVAMPLDAGGALLWNANVAHWGGSCDPSFDEPRISVTFTASRKTWNRASGPANVRWPISFRDRLDLIAGQLVTYGPRELAAERREMRWATMLSAMREAARRH
jgi:hypothetical protein